MKFRIVFCVLLFFLSVSGGCAVIPLEEPLLDSDNDQTVISAVIETVTALAAANTASAPVNPWNTPIGVGLVGLSAMLEALRRKEKGARKNAEARLNNGNGKV